MTCSWRPRCEWRLCDRPSIGSAIYPADWRGPRVRFICQGHADLIRETNNRRIPGLDPHPDNNDPEWRPSIMDMVRHAFIAEAFERRHAELQPDVPDDLRPIATFERRWMPEQRRQAEYVRKVMREIVAEREN